MKKAISIGAITAAVSTAALATYAFMNKSTKKNADKLLNTMIDDANSVMQKMK